MSTLDDTPATTSCPDEDLPVNPFVALRVAYGMLLGEDDFRTLIGHPRGKQMLHTTWLHGSGVIHGYRVGRQGTWKLTVEPGLALDSQGRELLLDAGRDLDVDQWLKKQKPADLPEHQPGETFDVDAYVVAEFQGCPAAPVPTLADPCDVTRRHDDFSRVLETTRLDLRLGTPPADPSPYHRVRVLLGLDQVTGPDDEAGHQATEAAQRVTAAPPAERAATMLHEFQAMAAHDGMDRRPAQQPGDPAPGLFPALDDDAAVVLAAVTITVRDADDNKEIRKVVPDPCVRRTLLPTATIQDLTTGENPDATPGGDAGGPRVIPGSLHWSDNDRCLSIDLTAAVNESSAEDAVTVTSLSDRGWVTEDINRIEHQPGPPHQLLIHLDDRPAYPLVRVLVRGTGDRPVYGTDPPVPLAGIVGGPPATEHDGHDAALTMPNPTGWRSTP
ncbi:hypothetical protein [Actinoplanes solisilvae]|uniref:hypothetical protein n=1 Tax=Actinoplanes solisilvae TaxID=2486853 RepID=UPI000FDAA085|nr:hypothetical protein [Actinoplanes solisilvae]